MKFCHPIHNPEQWNKSHIIIGKKIIPILRNRNNLHKTAEKCCTSKRDESLIGQYNTFLFPGFKIEKFYFVSIRFLLSDFLKGNIHCIVMIAVIHAQRSNKAVQCPNCVQTLFRITFIQITQDIYRTGQMSFQFLAM